MILIGADCAAGHRRSPDSFNSTRGAFDGTCLANIFSLSTTIS